MKPPKNNIYMALFLVTIFLASFVLVAGAGTADLGECGKSNLGETKEIVDDGSCITYRCEAIYETEAEELGSSMFPDKIIGYEWVKKETRECLGLGKAHGDVESYAKAGNIVTEEDLKKQIEKERYCDSITTSPWNRLKQAPLDTTAYVTLKIEGGECKGKIGCVAIKCKKAGAILSWDVANRETVSCKPCKDAEEEIKNHRETGDDFYSETRGKGLDEGEKYCYICKKSIKGEVHPIDLKTFTKDDVDRINQGAGGGDDPKNWCTGKGGKLEIRKGACNWNASHIY